MSLSAAEIAQRQEDGESLAAFLILELCQCGFDISEYIGQMMASLVHTDMLLSEAISEMADSIRRAVELANDPTNIWPGLMPGGPGSTEWHIISDVDYSSLLANKDNYDSMVKSKDFTIFSLKQQIKQMEQLASPDVINIVLTYGLDYHKGDTVYHCPRGAEFFIDEHGRQWIKFVPSNGYDADREHMFIVEAASDWIVRRT